MNDLTTEPAGSMAPVTLDGQWNKGVDAKGLNTLAKVADKIDATIDATQKAMAVGQIAIGKQMNIAREVFPEGTGGDKGFATWRSSHWQISAVQARRFMAIAKEFGNSTKLVENMPPSSLVFLLSASMKVRLKVEEAIDAGETVTREDVRGLIADDKAEPKEVTGKEGMPVDRAPPPEHILTVEEQQQLLMKDEARKFKRLRRFTGVDNPKDYDCDWDLRGIIHMPGAEERHEALLIAGEVGLPIDELTAAFALFGSWTPDAGYEPNLSLYEGAYDGWIQDGIEVNGDTTISPRHMEQEMVNILETALELIVEFLEDGE